MHAVAYSLFFLSALAFVLLTQRLDHGGERAKPAPRRTSPPRQP